MPGQQDSDASAAAWQQQLPISQFGRAVMSARPTQAAARPESSRPGSRGARWRRKLRLRPMRFKTCFERYGGFKGIQQVFLISF